MVADENASKTLEERIAGHSAFFNDILSMIPAKYYFVKEEDDSKWNKFSQNPSTKAASKLSAKENSKKAKKLRLDPTESNTVPDIQRKQLENDESEEESDEEMNEIDYSSDEEDNEDNEDNEEEGNKHGKKRKVMPAFTPISVPNVQSTATIEDLRTLLHKRIEEARKRRQGNKPDTMELDKSSGHGAANGAESGNKRKKAKEALKLKQDQERKKLNAQSKGIKISSVHVVKGAENSENDSNEQKIVFSKFDFANQNNSNEKKKKKKLTAQQMLLKVESNREKMIKLEETDKEKAQEVKEKKAWTKALKKAEGEKIIDDPNLIKKTIKRQQKRKEKSKDTWESRKKDVQRSIKERQNKREENIKKRKEGKKKGKKGRPGFEGGPKKNSNKSKK